MKRSKKALSNFVNKHSKVSKMSIVFDRKNKMKEFITNPRSVLCVLKYWRAGGVQIKVCVRERDLLLKLTGTMKLKCGCQRNRQESKLVGEGQTNLEWFVARMLSA
jgi:hypothetical protein